MNRKRVQRLWREEGLKRPPQRPRKRRRVRPDSTERLRAVRPNHVWAIDFQFDETAEGRRLKLANIVDEHTREALAMRVGRCCTAEALITELEALVVEYGPPSFLRADNGPELIADALREWCRFSRIGISYIEPGSPWENPWVESFNGRARDELLNIEEFGSLIEAQVVVEAWRIEYNTYRPHGALGGLTPPRPAPHGSPNTNQHSHDRWTTERGPLSTTTTRADTHRFSSAEGGPTRGHGS